MLYFSELVGKHIVTEDGVYVGKFKDFIFLAIDHPIITKISIDISSASPHDPSPKISLKYLKTIGKEIIISKHYEAEGLNENELYVFKNLMDQQIIDIKGNKVVRVNDVVIQTKPEFYISGVDIGVLGILRWLKLTKLSDKILAIFGRKLEPQFLSWANIQPLELSRGRIILRHEEEKLEKIRAEDLADHLEKINIKNVDKLISILDKEFAAQVIQNLNLTYQRGLFRNFTSEKAAEVISLIDSDESVDILLGLPEKKRLQIIELLSPDVKKDISHLMNLYQTPIGEFIVSEFITVKPDNTVRQVIQRIKNETRDFYLLTNIYVVNDNEELIGVFNIHELIMQSLDTQVYKFMIQNVIVVHLQTPKELAVKRMLKYKIRSLPVIDDDKHIQGIIIFEEVVEKLLEI